MASTAKCRFCGAVVTSDQKQCPECGAENDHYVEDKPEWIVHPKTINELKEYCAERGMPLLRMRFFIGEDFPEARAFGIYRDGDQFVVYKNKADGSRAVRYRGPDEQYAVNELFTKLLDECHMRGIYPDGEPSGLTRSGSSPSGGGTASASQYRKPVRKMSRVKKIVLISLAVLFAGWILYSKIESNAYRAPLKHGYYLVNNTYYYTENNDRHRSSGWYQYDAEGWMASDKPAGSALKINLAYKGDTVRPEWNIRAIPLHEKPEKGYYPYNGELYWSTGYSYSLWRKYDPLQEKWTHDPGPEASGRLLYFSDYYAGDVFRDDWEGFDYQAEQGYYGIDGKFWYYSDVWHLYDSGAWKRASCPVKQPVPFFLGAKPQDEWQVRAFPAESPEQGYYRYDGKAYYYSREVGSISKWAEFDTKDLDWHYSSGFPLYDPSGVVIFPADCYGGSFFPAEWEGRDYTFKDGYYRYQGSTYYFSKKSPNPASPSTYTNRLYRYEDGWRLSGYPVGNLSSYYKGQTFLQEWGGEAFHMLGDPAHGYYRYDGELYYAIRTEDNGEKIPFPRDIFNNVNLWYRCTKNNYWEEKSFPLFDAEDRLLNPEDYFLGAEYDAAWGGSAFRKASGYYRKNGSIYYYDGNKWYRSCSGNYSIIPGYSWSQTSTPDDIWDYYSGSSMPGKGTSYTTWRTEEDRKAEIREKQSNSRDNDWHSNEYDDWHSNDTNWDDDW